MPLSSLERKTDRVTFYLILPILVQFLFLKFFLEKWAQVFVCARRWVLHLPPTQKHVFAYGIYATFVWHMFVYLAPRMGSLRQWVGGGTASQSLLLFFIFLVEELWISKWLQLCFFFFSSSPPPEEKDKQGQNTDRKEAVVSRRTLRMHTLSHLIHWRPVTRTQDFSKS